MKIVVKRRRAFAPEVRAINKCYRLVTSVVCLLLHVWEALADVFGLRVVLIATQPAESELLFC
jgi:hypothetical protein